VLSLAGLLASFSLTGMGVAVTQAVARGKDGTLAAAARVQFAWSLLVTGAAWAAVAWYLWNGNRELGLSMLVVGAATPVIESASLYGAYLSGKKAFRTDATYGAVKGLVPAAALLATMALTEKVLPLVVAYFAAHAAVNAALYWRTLRAFRPSGEADLSNIGFGKHVSLTNVFSIAASHLDKILIFQYLGAAPLAVYGIAFSVPGQMKILMKIATNLMMPKMSAAPLAAIRSAIHGKALRMLLAFAAVVAAYVALAPAIFRIFFPNYLEAVGVSQVIALGYLCAPAVLYSQTFFAHKRNKEIYANKIGAALMRVALLALLLPPYGVWGAAAAYVLGNVFSLFLTLALFRRLKD
jgi:O-antigen/teichoic acid export membrane protein